MAGNFNVSGSNNRDREMLPFRFFCGNGDSSLAGLQPEDLSAKDRFCSGQYPGPVTIFAEKGEKVTCPGHEVGLQLVLF
jgi:hypothetical protein